MQKYKLLVFNVTQEWKAHQHDDSIYWKTPTYLSSKNKNMPRIDKLGGCSVSSLHVFQETVTTDVSANANNHPH